MKPPSHPLDYYCECQDGRHVRRVLPVPETPAEEALIAAYDDAVSLAVPRDELTEAIERFMATGATDENLAWATQADERILDRLSA